MAEADDVPLAGVVDDAVRIDRAALVLMVRGGDVVDLEALAFARRGDERAQVRRDRGIGLGDDGGGRERFGFAGVAAERGE